MNVQNDCNDSLSNSLTDIEIWTWCGSNLGEVRDEAATKDEVCEHDRFRGSQAGKFGELGNPEQLIDVYMCGATFVECFSFIDQLEPIAIIDQRALATVQPLASTHVRSRS